MISVKLLRGWKNSHLNLNVNVDNVANKLQRNVEEKLTHQWSQEPPACLRKDKSRDKHPLHLLLQWKIDKLKNSEQALGKELAELFMERDEKGLWEIGKCYY